MPCRGEEETKRVLVPCKEEAKGKRTLEPWLEEAEVGELTGAAEAGKMDSVISRAANRIRPRLSLQDVEEPVAAAEERGVGDRTAGGAQRARKMDRVSERKSTTGSLFSEMEKNPLEMKDNGSLSLATEEAEAKEAPGHLLVTEEVVPGALLLETKASQGPYSVVPTGARQAEKGLRSGEAETNKTLEAKGDQGRCLERLHGEEGADGEAGEGEDHLIPEGDLKISLTALIIQASR